MSEETWTRDEPDSPCQRVCIIHPAARICIGCHRKPEEISGWAAMSREERHRILGELPGRGTELRSASNRPSRLRSKRKRQKSDKID